MQSARFIASITVLIVLFACLFSETHGAPTDKQRYEKTQPSDNENGSSSALKRRDVGELLGAFGYGLLGVQTGVKSTLEGIKHPTTKSSREEVIKSSSEAGRNVGGAIGSALKMG
jgi:hypothetical protein